MEISSNLGVVIRRLRRGQSLTQRDLADKLDISVAYINLIENNRRSITVPILLKVAKLFNIELSELTNDYNKQLNSDGWPVGLLSVYQAKSCTGHNWEGHPKHY